ncbi:MAG: serine/threonine-protein kinase [Planctomycetaceae bacterium]
MSRDSLPEEPVDLVLLRYESDRRAGLRPELIEWVHRRPDLSPGLGIELALLDFRLAWEHDQTNPTMEQFLGRLNPEIDSHELLPALVLMELELSETIPSVEAYAERFPDRAEEIRGLLAARDSSRLSLPRGLFSGSMRSSIRKSVAVPLDAEKHSSETVIETHDQFRIERLVDEGGMKWVHAAEQASTQRLVALKSSKSSRSDSLLSEGRLLARLEHPNIPPVVMATTTERGDSVLAEVLINGRNWEESIEEELTTFAELPPRERCKFWDERLERHLETLETVCRPLQYAHDTWGLIHGDIKPKNVFLGRYGEVYLIDWGMATQFRDTKDASIQAPHRTEIASFHGTPAYAPPEISRCDSANFGPRTDVFLLGATLYHVLAGRAPFEATRTTERLRMCLASAQGTFPPLPEWCQENVDDELLAILQRAMSRHQDDRYGSPFEFATALREYRSRTRIRTMIESVRDEFDLLKEEPSAAEVDSPSQLIALIGLSDRVRQSALGLSKNDADPLSKQARETEVKLRERLCRVAESGGDFALAESQVELLSQLVPERASEWTQSRTRLRSLHRSRERMRSWVRSGTVALLVMSCLMAFLYIDRAKVAKLEAEAARRAESNRLAAIAQRDRAFELSRESIQFMEYRSNSMQEWVSLQLASLDELHRKITAMAGPEGLTDEMRRTRARATFAKAKAVTQLVPPDLDQAKAFVEEAIADLEPLRKTMPDVFFTEVAEYREHLAMAFVQVASPEAAQTVADYELAVNDLIGVEPKLAEATRHRGYCTSLLASVASQQKRSDRDVMDLLDKSATELKTFLASSPHDPKSFDLLLQVQYSTAQRLILDEKCDQAIAVIDDAIQATSTRDPDIALRQLQLGNLHSLRASACANCGRMDEAIQNAWRSLSNLQTAGSLEPLTWEYRIRLLEVMAQASQLFWLGGAESADSLATMTEQRAQGYASDLVPATRFVPAFIVSQVIQLKEQIKADDVENMLETVEHSDEVFARFTHHELLLARIELLAIKVNGYRINGDLEKSRAVYLEATESLRLATPEEVVEGFRDDASRSTILALKGLIALLETEPQNCEKQGDAIVAIRHPTMDALLTAVCLYAHAYHLLGDEPSSNTDSVKEHKTMFLEKTLRTLDRAISKGFFNHEYLERFPEIKLIRQLPEVMARFEAMSRRPALDEIWERMAVPMDGGNNETK